VIINIDNALIRLHQRIEDFEGYDYCPFVVTIYRDARSRSPIRVRRKTLREAMAFVEEVTGLSAIRWVTTSDDGSQFYAFTGVHAKRYEDVKQYKPARIPAEVTT
jgi:hypothetical protein